jgi:SAM-dependent methyltransferase
MNTATTTLPSPSAAPNAAFAGSASYWEQRYAGGGTSGAGSYGRLARFKGAVVNELVEQSDIGSVIDLGCGDGHQLGLMNLPAYIGFDVSHTSLEMCRDRYRGDERKRFLPFDDLPGHRADLTLSLDVVYHLVEDDVFERYMHGLFDSSRKLVLVYASDPDSDLETANNHVRHRAVTKWVAGQRDDFELLGRIENAYPLQADPVNESFAHFMIFKRVDKVEATKPAPVLAPTILPLIAEPRKEAAARLPREWLDRLPPTRQIVAGMATIAGNEGALFQAVNSLLPQVDRIDLYANAFEQLPALLQGHPKLRCVIDREGTRYGDAGKFWGLQDCADTIYLSCDDDIDYPADYVSRMVEVLARHGGACAVSVHAALLRQCADDLVPSYYEVETRTVFHFERELAIERRAHVPGTGTTVFHSHFVKPGMHHFPKPNMADLWLAVYLREQALPVVAVARPARWLRQLPVERPTIYEHSSQQRPTAFNTGAAQSEIAARMHPISTLQARDSQSAAYVIRIESRVDLDGLLQSISDADANGVVFLIDALQGAERPLALRDCVGFLGELHILPKTVAVEARHAYRLLLATGAARVHCLALQATLGASALVDLGAAALAELIPLH